MKDSECCYSTINDYGFRLRLEKCNFFLRSVKYLGFIIDQEGRRPDPASTEAIRSMISTTRSVYIAVIFGSFLGLVSYYSTFLPAMHEARAPLNQLLMKDCKFNWTPECQTAFESIKSK